MRRLGNRDDGDVLLTERDTDGEVIYVWERGDVKAPLSTMEAS